jgi:hypothetical protein
MSNPKKQEEIPIKLTIVQLAFLLGAIGFMILTWTLGGDSGYTSGVGTAIPWVIGSLALVSSVFIVFAKGNQLKFDLSIACLVFSIFDYGMMPVSSMSIDNMSISGFVVAVSLGSYIVYLIHVIHVPVVTSVRRLMSIICSPLAEHSLGWHSVSALPICLDL